MKTIAVSGSSGLIGRALVASLEAAGQTVRRLVRREAQGTHEIHWDPAKGEMDAAALAGVDAVVHLAAENIAQRRWNREVKDRIRKSRVDGTRLVAEVIAQLEPTPAVLVAASAIGYYGDRGHEQLAESAPPGSGFLADVCQAWEAAATPATDAGIRVVNLRIGVVLSREGGALARMLTPFRCGLGGVVGKGHQFMSWIERDDLVRAIAFLIDHADLQGPVNLVAPNPVTNREFAKALGAVLKRPTIFPLPAFMARLVFGEMGEELLLASTRALPTKLSAAGFEFQYPDVQSALRRAIHKE